MIVDAQVVFAKKIDVPGGTLCCQKTPLLREPYRDSAPILLPEVRRRKRLSERLPRTGQQAESASGARLVRLSLAQIAAGGPEDRARDDQALCVAGAPIDGQDAAIP